MIRLIDKMPPAPSGDAQRDAAAALEYMSYLREQMNFILTNLNREAGNNG